MSENNTVRVLIGIIEDWQDLIEQAQTEYVFDDPLDVQLFKKCMKATYEYFFPERVSARVFETFEAELYGAVVGYSTIPAVTEGENSVLFEASTHVAGFLAYAILHPEYRNMENGKMESEVCVHNEFRPVVYDFESGNLKDFIELVEIGFWD